MSGYLGHLIQRSLTAVPGVRPRPVSIFETSQPPTAPEAQADPMFGPEPYAAASDDTRTDRRLAPVPDADSPGATSAMAAAPVPHPAPWLGPRDSAPHGMPQEPPNLVSRRASGRTAAFANTPVQAAYVRPTAQAAADRVGEETTLPPVAGPTRRRVRTREALKQRDEAPVSHDLPGETPIHDEAAPDLLDSDNLRAPRFHVQGKLAAQAEFKHAETHPVASSAQEGTPAGRIRTAPGESPDRATAAEPDVRVVASPADPLRSVSRDASPAAPMQAILTPRLPHAEPLAQSVQPAIGPASEPVVHVTIGRVEIRAVAAPSAVPKRSAAPKPALSLSDYLQQRSGGHG